jgi:dipeptidyl aminopeptidase/acylaminoacyl peptidase
MSSFTIERVLAAPFPTQLTAAPAKSRVAWVFNAQGRRNIWVGEPGPGGAYNARQMTSYTEDDGQDLGELTWTPDAETIVYTRGGDLTREKTYPNPQNSPQGGEQDIWAISLSGGEPRRLGEGHSPALSPRGDAVAFIFKNQVWLTKLGSEKSEQLIHANGNASSLRWSSDGLKLAFVSRRGDHGFIGIYDIGAKSIVYLDPSVDTDLQPAWSADGQRIAFIRIPASKGTFVLSPQREGQPWSIRIADVTTGKGREVWHAEPGRGSVFREVVAQNQLMWGAGDRIVFPWERDGWTHLYSLSATGGSAKLITPGNFEVEFVVLSPNRQEVVYSSNQDDIDRRHVWKVPASGDQPKPVTSGTGIETEPVVISDNLEVAALRSDARLPLRPAMISRTGEVRDLAPDAIPSDFPLAAMVTPQQVVFPAADGLQIHGQLFLPANLSDGARHPAVVFFHGGSRRQMLLGWHYREYYNNAYAMNQYLASRGYIVLSVNYRSGIGYGLDFREALGYGASGASEFSDVLGAGAYLRNRPDVDPRRIGLWGGSYGGYLTALGLARASDLFAAGVDMHGVHDWKGAIPEFYPSYNPDPDEARLAWESSPLSSIKTWRSPVLLIQGDDDRNVPFAEMVDLVDALRKQGVEFEQLVFPGEIHEFLLHHSWIAAYTASAAFLNRHLGMIDGSPMTSRH